MLSSDKHWHAVLEHCLALLESYDSSTAVSAVTGRSGVRVTVLGHCQALPYDPVTASVKDLYRMWKILEHPSQNKNIRAHLMTLERCKGETTTKGANPLQVPL